MGIIAAGQITVVDLSDAPVLNAAITASRPTTQTYSKDSDTYNPSYESTPQVLTLSLTKSGSTTNIIDSISSLHWFVADGYIKTEITSKDNTANEYISGTHNEILTTKLDIDRNKGSRRYEVMGIWPDPSTGLDVHFGGYIDLLLTQNGATGAQGPQGPQGDKGDTGNGIANTVITYGLSMSDTTEPATWSSDRPALVKGMYLWIRTVIIYTNGESTTSYQIGYIPQDADASAAIDKTKQELLEKLETVRDDSLEAVEEAKQQLATVRDESLAAAEEAKQQITTVSDDLSKAKTDFQNAVSAVDTKATNLKSDLAQAKQDLASQAQQLQEQAGAQSELTNRVSSVEKTANGTKTTVSELSKTVAQNGKDITNVTARTKVVEDDLAGTKTTLSQVQTTANSTSQKTATLETGLNGLTAKFNSLSVGNKNYLPTSRVVNRGCNNFSYSNTTKSWSMTAPASSSGFGNGITFNTKGLNILLNGGETLFFGLMIKANKACSFNYDVNNALSGTTSNDNDDTSKRAHFPSNKSIPANVWTRVWFSYTAKANVPITEANSNFGIVNNTEPVTIEIKEVMVAKSNVPVDYQAPDADIEQKVAEYKQNADQNYASLQTTVQNLDGTVQHNKTVADQTAQGFTTRIESLETYKDGESTRANQYFESARTETARQLTAERTAIAKDYVAKSTYTSDVTGIRNELSATTSTANTTKTNLANYQASNDRAVANLQSNIQTANGNISSLKTKVEAVPGQITSAVSSVESKIPTEIGTVNLLKNSKTFTGSNITGSGAISSETYQGCAVRHLKVTGEVAIAEFTNCVYPKLGGEYVASFWAKGKGGLNVFFHGNRGYLGVAKGVSSEGNETTRGDGLISFNLTADWKRYWIKYKMKMEPSSATNVGKHLLFRTLADGSENEVYLAGAQLEEGNIVSGYSPNSEDYDSKLASVEGKIPTNVSTRNLILKSNDFANPHKSTGDKTTVTSTNDYFVLKSTGYTANGYGGISWNMSISEVKAGEEFSILMPVYIDSSVNLDNGWAFILKNHSLNSAAYDYTIPTNKKDQWFNVAITFKTYKDVVFDSYPFYVCLVKNGLVRIKPPMLVRGNLIPSDYQPAFEDTQTKITTLNTTLTQTANGLEQLSTKVTSQGNTINTHTTQISSLNTGLQTKVSQTDFNTLSGRVTSAENNITAKANELSSKITSVEGKIPTSVGGRNYIKNSEYRKTPITVNDNQSQDEAFDISPAFWQNSNVYNKKIKLSFYYQASVAYGTERKFPVYFRESPWPWIGEVAYPANTTRPIKYTIAMSNALPANFTAKQIFIRFTGNLDKGRDHTITKVMLEVSDVFSDWQPAPEDAISQISSLSSELKQTKDGITLLATKTELNTAKSDLQSGINTATNKANAAQNTANSAQNKANSNAQTISTHTTQISALNTGLSAKVSQSDFNTLSGRVTTAENNITAKANELSSKISSVEGKLPSGETNLVEYGRPANGYSPYPGAEYTTHGFYYNGAFKMYIIRNKTTSEKTFGMNRFKVERNTEYTLYFKGFNNWQITNMDVWFLKRVNGSKNDYDSAQILVSNRKLSNGAAENISVTFNTGEYDEGYLRFDNNGTTTAGTQADLYFGDVSVKKGRSNNGWSPSVAELASSQDLKSAQSEIKQTTDSIKASVSSLDQSTIKSSSLTINSDGIVMKAGKSTTDVANAIGSYFAVNQNAIDLFADKIKVKGNMIVNGTITGDKIKASSVDVSKIVGIDANFIKSKIEYAMIDWLKGKTITAYNDNMTIDLQNGRISFKDGRNAVYRQTPDGIHTGFLHFEAGSLGGIYAAFGATSTRQGINSKSSEFAGIRCYRVSKNGDSHDAKIDKIEVIGDTIQFGHGYGSDGSIGGGFIMHAVGLENDVYSLNRIVKSIDSIWRVLNEHARNVGFNLSDRAFVKALTDEYNAWHDTHHI